jgi:hypothetical protein
MIVICSWCRREGKMELVGEKAPFEDVRETHGICVVHRDQVRALWWESFQRRGNNARKDHEIVRSTLFHWTGLLNSTKKMRTEP